MSIDEPEIFLPLPDPPPEKDLPPADLPLGANVRGFESDEYDLRDGADELLYDFCIIVFMDPTQKQNIHTKIIICVWPNPNVVTT